MGTRREQCLDTAIVVLSEGGTRALTHRKIDETAGLAPGSCSNYFRTRSALLSAVVLQLTEADLKLWQQRSGTAGTAPMTTVESVVAALLDYVASSTTEHRALTLARYQLQLDHSLPPQAVAQLRNSQHAVHAVAENVLSGLGCGRPAGAATALLAQLDGIILRRIGIGSPRAQPRIERRHDAASLHILLQAAVAGALR